MQMTKGLAVLVAAMATQGAAHAQAMLKCNASVMIEVKATPAGSGYDYSYRLINSTKTNLTMYVFIQNFPADFTVDPAQKQRSGVRIAASQPGKYGEITQKFGHSADGSWAVKIEKIFDTTSTKPYISVRNCQVTQ